MAAPLHLAKHFEMGRPWGWPITFPRRLQFRGLEWHLRSMERTLLRTSFLDNTKPSRPLPCPPYLCDLANPRRRSYICPWSRHCHLRHSRMAGFLAVCHNGRLRRSLQGVRVAQCRDIAMAGMAVGASSIMVERCAMHASHTQSLDSRSVFYCYRSAHTLSPAHTYIIHHIVYIVPHSCHASHPVLPHHTSSRCLFIIHILSSLLQTWSCHL